MRKCALTTVDNPFDPFDDFTSWIMFDMEKGYNSCAYLARMARISDQFTDEENDEEIEQAIDKILSYDFQGLYKKVIKEVKPTGG